MKELSNSQKNELDALVGDKMAVMRVVSDLRKYRAAAIDILSRRYRDGECDAVALSDFEDTVKQIEDNI
jgi:hypothetical protein